MNYIENIFICLTAPLLTAVICLKGTRRRMLLFLLAGMTACLFSSYISTFLAAVLHADRLSASLEIAPMVEEILKLFPLLFYLMVFEPRIEDAAGSMLMIAAGFATFENVCYLTANGAANMLHLLIRGFATGAWRSRITGSSTSSSHRQGSPPASGTSFPSSPRSCCR